MSLLHRQATAVGSIKQALFKERYKPDTREKPMSNQRATRETQMNQKSSSNASASARKCGRVSGRIGRGRVARAPKNSLNHTREMGAKGKRPGHAEGGGPRRGRRPASA